MNIYENVGCNSEMEITDDFILTVAPKKWKHENHIADKIQALADDKKMKADASEHATWIKEEIQHEEEIERENELKTQTNLSFPINSLSLKLNGLTMIEPIDQNDVKAMIEFLKKNIFWLLEMKDSQFKMN